MAKKIISFEITCEGYVVAPITKHFNKMNNKEKLALKNHLLFHANLIKVKPCDCKKK